MLDALTIHPAAATATLRQTVQYWRDRGQVLDFHSGLSARHEVAAVTAEVQDRGNEICVFHQVNGHAMPVVTNIYGSRHRLGAMLGVGGVAGDTMCRAINTHIARGQALGTAATVPAIGPDPRREVALGELPLLTYHAEDAGAYLTTGILLVRDPDTGVRNLSFHRGMRVSDTELRISIGPRHDLGRIQRLAEERGETLEAAFLVGVTPALFLAACTSIPPDADEVALAAAIAGAPFPVRPAATIDLQIPDGADIVIEGRILPRERRAEAPFGEWMGYYVPEKQSHVFQVMRTAARPQALLHGLVCGSGDDLRPLEATTAARIYKTLTAQFDCVLDVVCFPSMLVTAVKIRQAYEGQSRQVLMAAITAHFLYSKVCIVVDEDVDIYRLDDVLWAYATRARPDERTQVLGQLPGFFRDPHKDHWGRLGLDGTMPWGRFEEFRRKQIPGRDKVDLQALLAVPAAMAS